MAYERAQLVRNLLGWLERVSYIRLAAGYVGVLVASLVIGWFSFYFLVYPLYSLLGREFSNLGPIATFSWGVLFVVFVLTPAFVVALLAKFVGKWRRKA